MTYDHRRQKRGPYDHHWDWRARREGPSSPAQALRMFRKALGLTQAEFAAPLPFGRTAIVNYERGERHITAEALAAIHAAYPTAKDDLPLRPCNTLIWNAPCRLLDPNE